MEPLNYMGSVCKILDIDIDFRYIECENTIYIAAQTAMYPYGLQ